jgi:hypothetical protein
MQIVIDGFDERTVKQWKQNAAPADKKPRPIKFGIIQVMEVPSEQRGRKHRDEAREANLLMNYRGPCRMLVMDSPEETLEDLSVVGVQQRLAQIEKMLVLIGGPKLKSLTPKKPKQLKGKKASTNGRKKGKKVQAKKELKKTDLDAVLGKKKDPKKSKSKLKGKALEVQQDYNSDPDGDIAGNPELFEE